MNTYFKGCLIILLVFVLLAAALVGIYYWRKEHNKKQAFTDQIKFSKICDTTRLITERPILNFENFKKQEIKKLRYYLVRKATVVKDTLVSTELINGSTYLNTQFPFEQFLKTDTIVVETQGSPKRHYLISGFSSYAYLHYGMMGYLGSYDCRLNEEFMVNGKKSTGTLLKQDGKTGNFMLPVAP